MRDITWPSLCPNCGATASEVLEVPKVFLRFPRPNDYSRPSTGIYWKEVARFPFCADCAALHHSLVDRPSFSRQVLRTLLTPLMIPVVGSLWMLSITVPQAVDVAPRVTNANEAMIAWGLVLLPMFIIVWTLVLAWRSSLHDRIEKQTEVTRACDYSGDVSDFLERERRLFAIRDRAFAEALVQLNSHRVWTAEDDKRSGRRRERKFYDSVQALQARSQRAATLARSDTSLLTSRSSSLLTVGGMSRKLGIVPCDPFDRHITPLVVGGTLPLSPSMRSVTVTTASKPGDVRGT